MQNYFELKFVNINGRKNIWIYSNHDCTAEILVLIKSFIMYATSRPQTYLLILLIHSRIQI